ncbi:MAG: hypothetical protein IKI08_05545 [Selenomonadaceae bacterium]|nr:hypothetical protein [Selenomonadaceae bacterium]
MTDIERDTERRITNLESNVNNLIAEMRDFKNEMRQQNKMRAEEIREIRQDMKNMQASLDAKIDGMGKHVRNLSVATIIGVATIAITVVYSILMH